MNDTIRIVPCGDAALSVEFENEISEAVHAKVSSLTHLLTAHALHGVQELIPTYRALMICFDPVQTDFFQLKEVLFELLSNTEDKMQESKTVIEIPVCYGGEYGPDLEYVAKFHGLTVQEVIRIHSEPDYLIYMLGFTPGFPYLGGMSKKIATPRLEIPRTKLKAGSVGIAGEQTGLYPLDSPGGWQIIGRTPLDLYDPQRDVPILLEASQYIRFVPIQEERFLSIRKEVEAKTFSYQQIKHTV